ncbi:hypothetical protein Taro_013711 [Colocasia esculenta]|uniref:Uncharacterized protein n=1 Tax=Colocasia esculenta TaxID=4460 RepID=A0A843UGA8_COLES|nr:hypothetical protein [Colocasia esculenta]
MHGLRAFLHVEHAPLPMWNVYIVFFGVVPGRTAPEPPSAEDVTTIEVTILSRRPGWWPHDRDALGRRNLVVALVVGLGRRGRSEEFFRAQSS